MDNNNNSVDNLDIENDPDVELPIRCSEDKESRMTEANSIAGDIIDDEDQIQDNEGSEFRDEVFSTTQGRTEELSTLNYYYKNYYKLLKKAVPRSYKTKEENLFSVQV